MSQVIEKKNQMQREVKQAKEERINGALQIVKGLEVNERGKKDLESIPVRKYLMNFLDPVLTEGLQKVIEIRPKDSVDFLAEYIYRRSYEF